MNTDTPTLDKLSANAYKRTIVLDFLEWAQYELGAHLATYHKHTNACKDAEGFYCCGANEERLYSVLIQHDNLVLRFLEIDEKKIESERQMLLDQLRNDPMDSQS